jgi:hypothetical protein
MAALLAFALIAHASAAFASCWASNPDGTRSCDEYINHGGGYEYLCEDQPGDCSDLGYTKVARPRASFPDTRLEPERRSAEPHMARVGERPGRSAETRERSRADDRAASRAPSEDSTAGHRALAIARRRTAPQGPDTETGIAAILIAVVAVLGIAILPPAHRGGLFQVVRRVAFAVGIVFLFVLALAGLGSNRKRRRYY